MQNPVMATPNPEVLSSEWLPPLALGRGNELREVVLRLDPPRPRAPTPWVVAVAGGTGSGTSTVARRAARETVERLQAASAEPVPRILAVRTASLRGPHGVATALLRRFDEGFDGRGFPVAEVIAGVLRRLRRDGRPTVVVLDDIDIGGPDLGPILRAFANPDRFLPEGESGLPPLWTILAGTREGLVTALAGLDRGVAARPFVELREYGELELRAIVRDRAERALGREAPSSLVTKVIDRTLADGGGARRAVELLRRELVGRPKGLSPAPAGGAGGIAVEPRVVRAIESATGGIAARLGDVKRREAELALAEGSVPLPTTTLWRRIVRLERAGYVRREIRPGGAGGTSSIVRILSPIDEWVTAPGPYGTPRAVAVSSSRGVDPGSAGYRWSAFPPRPSG
jgi:hypothetical protein